MIDTFSIVLAHALLAIMVWRLLQRPDLDHEESVEHVEHNDSESGPENTINTSKKWGQAAAGRLSQKGFRNRA